MKRRNTFSLFEIVAFVVLIAGGIFMSGCESSRIGPTVPAPNPSSPTPPPLLLTGNVVDSKTSSIISGASVQISRQDGTSVATVVTDNRGVFSYDISTVNQALLKVTATAAGYGTAFMYDKIDLVNRSSVVLSIPLDKLTTTPVTVTNSSGGNGTTSSTESKNINQQVTITVPAGSVASNTTLQLNQIPVNNVPPPSNAANTTQVGVANLQPVGITFAKPVLLSFPLPYQFKPGDQIPLNILVNGTWQSASLNATVDNTGYLANVNITQTNEYSLLDNSKITGGVTRSIVPFNDKSYSPRLLKAADILDTRDVTLTTPSTTISLPVSSTVTVSYTNVLTSTPSGEWLFNVLAQTYGDAFLAFSGPGTQTSSATEVLNWPSEANPNALNQSTGTGNKKYPNDFGSWSVVFHLASTTLNWANVVITSPYWTATIIGIADVWNITGADWVWTGHDQGGIYPF